MAGPVDTADPPTIQSILFRQAPAPAERNLFSPVIRARQLAVDRTCRVRIIAKIDRQQTALAKRGAAIECPQRRFE